MYLILEKNLEKLFFTLTEVDDNLGTWYMYIDIRKDVKFIIPSSGY